MHPQTCGDRNIQKYTHTHILIRTHVSLTWQSRDESWQREKQTGKHKYQINMFSQTASRPEGNGRETVNTRKPTRQPPSRAQPPTGPFSLPTTHPIQITKQKRRVKRNIFIDIAVVGLRFSVLGSRYSVLGFRAMSNAHWISVSSSSSNH